MYLEFRHSTAREITVQYRPPKEPPAALDEPDGVDEAEGKAGVVKANL